MPKSNTSFFYTMQTLGIWPGCRKFCEPEPMPDRTHDISQLKIWVCNATCLPLNTSNAILLNEEVSPCYELNNGNSLQAMELSKKQIVDVNEGGIRLATEGFGVLKTNRQSIRWSKAHLLLLLG